VIGLYRAQGVKPLAHFTPEAGHFLADVLEAARDHRGQLLDRDAACHLRSS